MSKKKTHEEFVQEVFDLVGAEYTVLGQYTTNKIKILMRHNTCGNEYEILPKNFTNNHQRCPECFGSKKKTTEQFKEEVFDLVGNDYTVLGQYINNHIKILMRHNICGYEYEVVPKNFTNINRRCPKCNGNLSRLKTIDSYKKEVFDLVGDEYTVLGTEYKNCKTRILMQHNICGHEFYSPPKNFIDGNRCPKCAVNFKLTTDIFKQRVFNLVGDEYTVLGQYLDIHTKILMRHNTCGHDYLVKPNLFQNGNRCPKCKKSKGEEAIANFLDFNNIQYEREKTFKECKYKAPLRFDFYIPNVIHLKSGKLVNMVIEFNGEQHYRPVFGTGHEKEKLFQETQNRDKIKRDFIKHGQRGLGYNLVLITIPYTITDIEQYMSDLFNNRYPLSQKQE